jgi:FkbM family methyltransferase
MGRVLWGLEEELNLIKRAFNLVGLDVHKLYQPPRNRFKWLQEFNIRTIIDVGANRGQFAFMVQPFFPEAVIYCFEPQLDVADVLEKRVYQNRLESNIAVIKGMALGSFNGIVKLNRTKNTTDSSLLKMTNYFMGVYKNLDEFVEEDVRVSRLDDVDINIVPELMVKIDVEGYEGEVIKGARNTLDRAKVVYVEVTFQKERYEGQVLFDGLYSILWKKGFACFGFSQVYFHYYTGAPYYADAIFVRC